jgi:hypothetical protein
MSFFRQNVVFGQNLSLQTLTFSCRLYLAHPHPAPVSLNRQLTGGGIGIKPKAAAKKGMPVPIYLSMDLM